MSSTGVPNVARFGGAPFPLPTARVDIVAAVNSISIQVDGPRGHCAGVPGGQVTQLAKPANSPRIATMYIGVLAGSLAGWAPFGRASIFCP